MPNINSIEGWTPPAPWFIESQRGRTFLLTKDVDDAGWPKLELPDVWKVVEYSYNTKLHRFEIEVSR